MILSKPVAIIGMMGVGKTTIGKRLAKKFDISFIDSDAEIVRSAGMDIASIFDLYGEEAFRDTEEKIIKKLLERDDPFILSTGGGAVIRKDTLNALRSKTITMWLKAEPESILKNVSHNSKRPLLQEKDPLLVLKTLLEKRVGLYKSADIHIDCEKKNIQEIVEASFLALNDYKL